MARAQATDQSAVRAALAELVAELRGEMAESIEQSLARVRAEAPGAFREDDPDFADLYRESYREQLRFIYAGWENGREMNGRELPGILAEEARQAANRGIKLGELLLAYRICHRLFFEKALDRASERISDQELLAATLRATSRWLFAYFNAASACISESYERERDLLARDRDRHKGQIVRELLEGQRIDTAQLGYRLDQEHLAVIAWGDVPDRALSTLRDATGLSLLSIAGTGTTAWGWLGGNELAPTDMRAIQSAALPEGTQIALGEPGRGLDGFRLSHRQAWRTYRIVREAKVPVTGYAEVALLGLTIQDPELAHEFVVRELGALAGADERSARLRETLSAYFDSGHNASSAAASLGVRDRTVLYRIRSIEQQLGYPVTARREELGVALRLAPVVLNGAVR